MTITKPNAVYYKARVEPLMDQALENIARSEGNVTRSEALRIAIRAYARQINAWPGQVYGAPVDAAKVRNET